MDTLTDAKMVSKPPQTLTVHATPDTTPQYAAVKHGVGLGQCHMFASILDKAFHLMWLI